MREVIKMNKRIFYKAIKKNENYLISFFDYDKEKYFEVSKEDKSRCSTETIISVFASSDKDKDKIFKILTEKIFKRTEDAEKFYIEADKILAELQPNEFKRAILFTLEEL